MGGGGEREREGKTGIEGDGEVEGRKLAITLLEGAERFRQAQGIL